MTSWTQAIKGYTKQKIFLFLFLGFSCGLPLNLLGYSLAAWMRETGISLAVIGMFSLVLVPFSLKFLWAPIVDGIRIPFLADKVGPKKAWGIVFQIGLMLCIFGLAFFAPNQNTWVYKMSDGAVFPVQTYILAFLTAFFAASQDIVVDALRIDTLKKEELGEGAGAYQFGYRMGMLLSGAGVVAVSAYVSWSLAYFVAGCFISAGLLSILFIKENKAVIQRKKIKEFIVDPFIDFMKKNQWALVLIFIILYKTCNAVLGRMAMPFYIDVGFTKEQIALVSGAIGPWITMAGIPIGGILVMRFGILKSLFGLGIVEILTSLAFMGLAILGASVPAFLGTIAFDNIVGGMGGAVFVAYLSSLCSKNYSATQYALLSSLMMVAGSMIAAYSGFWVQAMGWPVFFLFTGMLMVPALCLLAYLMRREHEVI